MPKTNIQHILEVRKKKRKENLKAVTMTLRSKGLCTEEIPLGYGTTEVSLPGTELLLITQRFEKLASSLQQAVI